MICEACQGRRHGECRGGTWCDCQHEPPTGHRPAPSRSGTDTGGDARDGDGGGGDAEPGINWLRQG